MSKLKIPFLVSCILLIAACSLPDVSVAAPTPNIEQTVNAVRTESVLTVIATEATQYPTSMVPATETLAPSMTVAPSHTVHPTLTITPTNTYVPTLTTTPTITRTATRTQLPGGNPRIDIVGVEKNKAVSVKTSNFPAYQIFTIRIGRFDDFNNTKKVVGSINSGSGAPIIFTSLIPNELKDADRYTIRLDSDHGYYAYNAFENITSGTVSYTATPIAPTFQCSVTTSPSAYTEFPLGANFDASWEIKNTGTEAWDKAAVDYKHLSGTELQKYDKAFDLPSTVEPDGTITLVVDMVAPNTAGTYTATWAIVTGDTVLCTLPVTIKVK